MFRLDRLERCMFSPNEGTKAIATPKSSKPLSKHDAINFPQGLPKSDVCNNKAENINRTSSDTDWLCCTELAALIKVPLFCYHQSGTLLYPYLLLPSLAVQYNEVIPILNPLTLSVHCICKGATYATSRRRYQYQI